MSMRPVLFACCAGLALSACMSAPFSPSHVASPDIHRPVVTQENARLDLSPYGDVGPADGPAIAAFLREYREAGHGPLVVYAPPGADGAATADSVIALARDMGVALPDVALGVSAGDFGSPFHLSFTRYRAHAPECGRVWPSLSQTARSETYHNFGCAQNANLAAMIADPADLVWPREMTPADAQRRTNVLQLYRAGEVTASARGEGESVNVSGN